MQANFSAIGQHLESTCKAYAYRVRAQEFAALEEVAEAQADELSAIYSNPRKGPLSLEYSKRFAQFRNTMNRLEVLRGEVERLQKGEIL